jgi:membrane fusion protein, multidrug efflux system
LFLVGALVALIAVGLAASLYFMKSRGRAGDVTATGEPGAGTVQQAGAGGTVTLASTKKKVADSDKEKTPVPVSVSPIATGAVSSYITSTANLVAENEVKVLAESDGRVAELLVEEGNQVGRGRVLAGLVRDDAEIALKKAQLRAANARLAYDRAAKVVDENLMSREVFDKVAMDNEIAQQEMAEAKWRLEKTAIKAPFSGRVTERNVKLGQHVHPGDQLFTVSDFDPLIARIYLPEKDVFGLKEGREVRITLKADERTKFGGRIRQISPVVDTATGTVKVTVEATAPPSEVRPGAFVTIDIVRETHPQAVLLPREAVIRELQEAYVFVANGAVAEKRAVTLGLEEGRHIEALSGVKPGDQVIVAGQGGLKQGSPIKVIPAAEASDLGTLDERLTRG